MIWVLSSVCWLPLLMSAMKITKPRQPCLACFSPRLGVVEDRFHGSSKWLCLKNYSEGLERCRVHHVQMNADLAPLALLSSPSSSPLTRHRTEHEAGSWWPASILHEGRSSGPCAPYHTTGSHSHQNHSLKNHLRFLNEFCAYLQLTFSKYYIVSTYCLKNKAISKK